MLTGDQKKAIETMTSRFRRAEKPAAGEAAAPRLAKLAARASAPRPMAATNIAVEAPVAAEDVATEDVSASAMQAPAVDQAASAQSAVAAAAPSEPAEAAEEPAPEPAAAPAPSRPASRSVADPAEDQRWAREHLRWRSDDQPMLDLANVLRVLERHADFHGRFTYNPTLGRVLDKGSVVMEWRITELCSVIQERFLPEISEATVAKALLVYANRASAK